MESIIKTIFFILGAIVILGLILVLLPIIVLLYIFMPKSSTQTWFKTFSRGTRQAEAKDIKKEKTSFFRNIPASEDIIDVSADKIEK